MKLKYYNRIAKVVLTLFFLMSSCRSVSSDNPENITDPPVNTGNASVVVNLLGSEFVESDGNNPQASRGKQLRNPQATEIYYTLTDPSTLLRAEVSEDTSVTLNTSAGINPVALINGPPLANGAKFRLIAYKMDGSYANYKDFTVDGPPSTTGGLRLPKDIPYWMVVYSYGTNYLPGISFNETQSLGNAKLTYDNMAGQNGFLHQIQMFTPREGDNFMDVTLIHKIAQVTTKINSSALSAPNNITSVSSATLKGNNRNAEFKLLDASVQSRSTLQDVITTFVGQSPSTEWTSNAVFINAQSNPIETKIIGFSASIAINGNTPKTITVPNGGFRIRPGFRTTYKINLTEVRCKANVSGVEREFMCHNLGADYSKDPFKASVDIQGAKYQWGGTYSIAQSSDVGFANAGDVIRPSGWSISSKPANFIDPCTNYNSRYRVPKREEWEGLIHGNITESVGTPWNNNVPGGPQQNENYKSAFKIGTVFLPLAGYRQTVTNSQVPGVQGSNRAVNRGITGIYWSSTLRDDDSSLNHSHTYDIGVGNHNVIRSTTRITGASVRCIKKLDTET